VYEKALVGAGMLETYIQHHRKMNWACLEMSLTGVPVDQEARTQHAQLWEIEKARLRVELRELSGMELVAKKSLSSTKVLSYFYDVLACRPIRKKGQAAGLTANEVAVRRLMLKYKKARPVGEKLLEFRHAQKMSEFVAESRVDSDGRLRSLYRPLTKSGRLMASKTPVGTGTNLQNQPHKIRDIFVPSRPDWLLGSLDLSQAESRIVDGSSSDHRGLELARTPPHELDQHALMASEVLEKGIGEVTPVERQVVGKTGRHATNYGEGGQMMSDSLLIATESEIVRTPEECQDIIDTIMEKRPYIAKWQWWVKGKGIKGRVLTNSWGCRYVTPWWGVGEKDYKEWLAWGPQSEVTKLLDQCGWLPARQLIRAARLDVEILMQNHDELVFQGPPGHLFEVMGAVALQLSAPREYPGVDGSWELAMPVGWSVGRNFKEMEKWKETPGWGAFVERCEKLLGS
jgi:DNA polymerase-1